MILFWEALSVISFVPPRSYLFKVSNLSTRIICIKNVNVNNVQYERCQSRVFIVNCKHISNFVLIIAFEQASVYLVHKAITFEDKIEYIMHYVYIMRILCLYYAYFKREQNLETNSIWTFTIKTLLVNQWEIFAKEFVSDADSG